MNISYLHLGSNVGNRIANLAKALVSIGSQIGKISDVSPIYETQAWGPIDQPDYLNQAVKIETDLTSKKLLQIINEIEKKLGRKREVKWGPRIIDIDILFFNDEIIRNKKLTIPHPFLEKRNFVLEPLKDIAPDWNHPVFNKTIKELYNLSSDKTKVKVHSVHE